MSHNRHHTSDSDIQQKNEAHLDHSDGSELLNSLGDTLHAVSDTIGIFHASGAHLHSPICYVGPAAGVGGTIIHDDSESVAEKIICGTLVGLLTESINTAVSVPIGGAIGATMSVPTTPIGGIVLATTSGIIAYQFTRTITEPISQNIQRVCHNGFASWRAYSATHDTEMTPVPLPPSQNGELSLSESYMPKDLFDHSHDMMLGGGSTPHTLNQVMHNEVNSHSLTQSSDLGSHLQKLPREISTTQSESSTSLIEQRLNSPSLRMNSNGGCRSYTSMMRENNNASHELSTLQDRTMPHFFNGSHNEFRVPEAHLHSYFSNNSQRQLYYSGGDYSFFMKEREFLFSSDSRDDNKNSDGENDRCRDLSGDKNCDGDNCRDESCSDSSMCRISN